MASAPSGTTSDADGSLVEQVLQVGEGLDLVGFGGRRRGGRRRRICGRWGRGSSRAARLGSLRTLNGNHADSPPASPRRDESGRGYWAVSPSQLGFTHPGGCRAVGVGIEWM
jgi:hypothetical protein